MSEFTVGIIGAGRPWKSEGATGFGMSHAHAEGYKRSGKCEIIAVCDLVEENARSFSEHHAGGKAQIFSDYRAMLTEAKPDIVSICTWPHLHAEMTIAAAQAGVKAIHCEKPMAGTFGEARAMADACEKAGVQLTFNHQRRFLPVFQTAKKLVQAGEIGTLQRVEGCCGNMLDWGTHWLNLFLMLNEESLPLWVMGQVDVRADIKFFGVPHDTDGVCVVGFENGVRGTLHTGQLAEDKLGLSIQLYGTEGSIHIFPSTPHLIVANGSGRRSGTDAETAGGLHDNDANALNIIDLVNALSSGTRPLCDVTNALPTTEIIFATYESARRRGRIDLPLTITDSPLVSMIDAGIFSIGA